MYIQDNQPYEDLFDAISQFIAILDDHGKVVRVNRAAVELTRLSPEQITGVPLWNLPWQAFTKTNKREMKRAVEQAERGNFVSLELEILPNDHSTRTINFRLTPVQDDQKMVKHIIAAGLDISAYKKTSEALVQSNERFATIYNHAGIGIVIKAPDGRIIDCNPAFLSMLGYQLEEIRGKDYVDITHPADRATNKKLFNELQEGKRENYILEKRYLSKIGETVWVSVTASLVRGLDKKAQFTIVMAENITAQKQIETELIELRQRLMHGREMERLKLAQDLHDGPLQEIIGISFQLKELEGLLLDEASHEQLGGAQAALHDVSKSIRMICSELRPSTLMPFGLEKAILSHSEDFQAAHPEISLELDLQEDKQSLDEQVRIALFRIYQESLNNVIRHSQADKVKVHFWFDPEHAFLEVEDNGKGFKPPDHWIELARKGHLGLVGSIERVREVGGRFEVTSAVGKGTAIRAVIPMKVEVFLYD